MLGLIFIYFLGKYFYELARKYKKNEWGYAILGVVTYYFGTFVAGFMFVIIMEIANPGAVDDLDETLIGIIGLPFGLLAAWGLYKYLEKRFANELSSSGPSLNSEVLDDDFLQ